MTKHWAILAIAVGTAALATPAWAEEGSARDIQAAVDSYLATSTADATLVGGPGSAGYDAGFWIRGGDFSLRINATIQARWEAFSWEDDLEPAPGGDLSGFSLPRAVLKFSGTAPCDTRYYIELDFGHPGDDAFDEDELFPFPQGNGPNPFFFEALGPGRQSDNFSNTREAWIEWGADPAFNIRMGQIKLPTTRQLMTPPELQQFVDISLASAFVGQSMPGYTDRNRDHGLMLHGAFGCNGEFQYMLAITNGDSGDSIRNIFDVRTDDNLAYGVRLNWDFMGALGYEEGALRQSTCEWYGALGVWAYYHADRTDFPHTVWGDALRIGADVALGYGGFSFTAAFTLMQDTDDFDDITLETDDVDAFAVLVQLGYLFPDTAWELAVRASMYDVDGGDEEGAVTEIAGAINYYLNGHGNKLTLDASWIDAEEGVGLIRDLYAGYANVLTDGTALLIRFQWQLAL